MASSDGPAGTGSVDTDGDHLALRPPGRPADAAVRVRIDVSHPVMRAGWEVILQSRPDLSIVRASECSAGGEWDVTFVDAGDSDFADVLDRPGTGPVVVAVDNGHSGELLPGLVDGRVKAVVSADDSPEDLVAAVTAAARGHIWISAPLTWVLSTGGGMPCDRHELTERELELAHMLLVGATNADLAEAHDISVRTVKFHVSNIMRKLGVSRRSQIAHALNNV